MPQWERVRVLLRARAAGSSPTQHPAGQSDGRTVAAQLGDEAARVRLRRASALSATPWSPRLLWPAADAMAASAAVGCDESGLSRPQRVGPEC